MARNLTSRAKGPDRSVRSSGSTRLQRVRSGLEVTIGLLFAIGAVSQLFSTLPNSEQFYQDMSDVAWLPSAQAFIDQWLIPNSRAVTMLVVVFEAGAAIGILSRRSMVRPALMAGGAFSVIGAITASPAETIGYGLLAAVLFWLAYERRNGSADSPTSAGQEG